jgi:hypothetical protein
VTSERVVLRHGPSLSQESARCLVVRAPGSQ